MNSKNTLFCVLLLSVFTFQAQKTKIDEDKSLSVSGFANYSQIKKYVIDLKKGKKLKKKQIAPDNKKNPNTEYLDLIAKSKKTNNSEALYQFIINKDHKQSVEEAIKTGLGFMEPIYKLDFEMNDINDFKGNSLIKYYLIPDKSASRELHRKLSDVFNLISFEETWDIFTKKFAMHASKKAENFLNEYFEFQDKLSEDLIKKKVQQAEGSLKGSFAEISSVSNEMSKNPIQKLKNSGKYRLHNSQYFNDFIAPINKKTNKNINFIISPSSVIYKVFTKVITEPKLQPHHNLKLYANESILKEKYRKQSIAYDKVLKKELQEEFKQYAIRNLKKDLEIALAKKKGVKSYRLTDEEAKKIEQNTAMIAKYIKANNLVKTFKSKKEKEFAINIAKEWMKSEKKFKNYLNLYKSAMVSSSQYDILISNIMQDVKDAEIETVSYPLSSKLSMLKTYKEFIKLDRKNSGNSGAARLLGSIAKKTSIGKNLISQVNNMTAGFSGEISRINTFEDSRKFVQLKAKKLKDEVNSLYFDNNDLDSKIKGYTDVHMQLLQDAKKGFKLSIGEGSKSLDD
ncbi:hypothetical protein [Polaribacter sp. R77954]|uniref:hypothetical protein n=1 Tax=Polaribacter sp. R77954 TaxID=3093870 RepID=UPI0037CAB39A